MTRGSSLSDPKIIETINDKFVPVEHNITEHGFPDTVKGLRAWQFAFKRSWKYKFGFATSVVLTPDGSMPLGTSGSGHKYEWQTAANYHPELYKAFLDQSLHMYKRYRSLQEDESLTGFERKKEMMRLATDIMRSLREANHRGLTSSDR